MVAESVAQTKKQWTYTELVALDNEVRYELYDGELVEMASPIALHQVILFRLAFLIENWIRANGGGRLYMSPLDLYISETRCFVPDLTYYCQERFQNEKHLRDGGRCLITAPDLIIEVLSPSTERNDRVRKFNAYADFGVRHYWLIDPEGKTFLALMLTDEGYLAEASLSDEHIFEPTLFPGVVIDLAELFIP